MGEVELLNSAVKGWNQKTFQGIKNRYMSLINSPKRSGDGLENLRYSLGYHYGEVERISYRFERYLIYVHKGVGKGRGIGSGKERPKEWLNPELEDQLPELADIVSNIKADAALNKIQIK